MGIFAHSVSDNPMLSNPLELGSPVLKSIEMYLQMVLGIGKGRSRSGGECPI